MATLRTSFSAAGTESGGATYDSASVAINGDDTVFVLVGASDGSPVVPDSVTWDPTGAAQALTRISSTGNEAVGGFGFATIWMGQGLNPTTAVFRAAWTPSQGEQIIGGLVCTGVSTGTPYGTIGTATATDSTAVATSCSSTSGQLILGFVHYVDTAPDGKVFNSPSGAETFEVGTTGSGFDRIAAQSATASGGSTNVTWTLSAASSANSWRVFAIPVIDDVPMVIELVTNDLKKRSWRPRPFAPGNVR